MCKHVTQSGGALGWDRIQGENKNDENYSRHMDRGVRAARSWTDMR